MKFLGGLPKTNNGYDYLFIMVNHFRNMVILISCKKVVTEAGTSQLEYVKVFWVASFDYFRYGWSFI